MAQTGYTPILLYSSSTGSAAPAAGNLTNSTFGSELAINITDGKLFYKDNTNAVQVIAWKTTPTTAGGTGLTSYTAGDLPYYATGTTLSKLAIGTNGQILSSNGTAPQWTTLSGVAVTSISFGTTGLTPATATQGAVTVAGTLITTNGGTGLSSYTAGDLTYFASGTTLTKLAIGASGRWLGSSGTAPQWNAPAALTKTDDTNVTLTLGGSASTALLNAASLTLGWTGTLAVGRGGTGAATFTAGRILFGNGTSAINTSANLFWDNTNSWLGIGTNAPPSALSLNGDGNVNTAVATSKGLMVLSQGGITSSTGAGGLEFKSSTFGSGYGAKITNMDDGSLAFVFRQNSASWTERLRFFGTGGVSIGNTTDPGAGGLNVNQILYVNRTSRLNNGIIEARANTSEQAIVAQVQSNGNSLFQGFNSTGSVVFQATGNGTLYVTGAVTTPQTYAQTTGSAANVFVDSAGDLYRSTSSLKYKTDIQDATHGLAEVMQLRPVTYKGKADTDEGKTFGGLIAEEVDAIGLSEFVQYDDEGNPDALAYGNMVSLLTKAIQQQQAMIDSLAAKVKQLENK
jgi:hypothetical protein